MVAESTAQTDLLHELQRLVSPSRAPTLLRAAIDILGIEDGSCPSHRDEIFRLCRTLAGEGVLVQEMAEEIARELARR